VSLACLIVRIPCICPFDTQFGDELDLLKNGEANALAKGLDPNKMVVKHIQVDQAARTRRRTFRAHGRIGPFMCSPCHVQMFLSEPTNKVPAPTSEPKD
jgi:large subunit ribosomal protein L17e